MNKHRLYGIFFAVVCYTSTSFSSENALQANVLEKMLHRLEKLEQKDASWTPLMIKAGICGAALYAFDYYILGGRVIKHVSAKTREILHRIDAFQKDVDTNFDHINAKLDNQTSKINLIMEKLRITPTTEPLPTKTMSTQKPTSTGAHHAADRFTHSWRNLWGLLGS